MSDFFYDLVRCIGLPIIRITSRLRMLHQDRVPRRGAFLLAANHLSPYDVPLLIVATPRRLDFATSFELGQNPLAGKFLRGMNVAFVDRSRRDAVSALAMVKKLQSGRIVAMFPEGAIRCEENSVLNGGPYKPGIIRLAAASGVPIVPCAVLGSTGYHRVASWLPLASVQAAVSFGRPILVNVGQEEAAKRQLASTFVELAKELQKRNTNPTTP